MKNFLKQLKNKLKKKAGETLVETLVAIIICTFASTLLANGVAAGSKLNKDAREADKKSRESMEVVELRNEADPSQKKNGKIKIVDIDDDTAPDIEIDVTYVFSGNTKDDMTSYFTNPPA